FRPAIRPHLRAAADDVKNDLDRPGVQLLDTRTVPEFTGEVAATERGGHIPGAVRIDWEKTLAPDYRFKQGRELVEQLSALGIDPAKESVLYCASGPRAAHLYVALKVAGFGPARLYDRSFSEWGNRADLPVAGGSGDGK